MTPSRPRPDPVPETGFDPSQPSPSRVPSPLRGGTGSAGRTEPVPRARPAEVPAVSERDLTGYVRDLARVLGWRRYHTWLAKHSPAGFPDEVLVRPPRLVFAELKSERGKLKPDQEGWLDALRQVPGVEVYVWRPADMDEIAQVLR